MLIITIWIRTSTNSSTILNIKCSDLVNLIDGSRVRGLCANGLRTLVQRHASAKMFVRPGQVKHAGTWGYPMGKKTRCRFGGHMGCRTENQNGGLRDGNGEAKEHRWGIRWTKK